MATNKAKRYIHLAQPERRRPNHEPAGVLPVKAHVYHAIAELNAGLEKAIVQLKELQNIHFFRATGLTAMNGALSSIRAQANRQLMTVMNERETVNAGQFQQFRIGPKNR
jgi:hypothetical protein